MCTRDGQHVVDNALGPRNGDYNSSGVHTDLCVSDSRRPEIKRERVRDKIKKLITRAIRVNSPNPVVCTHSFIIFQLLLLYTEPCIPHGRV
jgi:hypothetical protein